MSPAHDRPGRQRSGRESSSARLESPDTPSPAARRYPARLRPRVLAVAEGSRTVSLMVGPVRGPEHLELIRRLRYYHVPVSAISASRIGVSYVAFYQPAKRFGLSTGLVREYAAVLRVSRVRRSELPGLTWPARGAPDAAYYRFDLGPIQRLARPITNPDRLRIAFRFPDFDRFCEAATLRGMGARAPKGRRTGGRQERSVPRSNDV
jgi:hypothetical protein